MLSFVKLSYKGEIRKVDRIKTFTELVELALEKFPQLPKESALNLKFNYRDSDSDLISISCENDLIEALDEFISDKTLKIIISLKDESDHNELAAGQNVSTQQIIKEETKMDKLISEDQIQQNSIDTAAKGIVVEDITD